MAWNRDEGGHEASALRLDNPVTDNKREEKTKEEPAQGIDQRPLSQAVEMTLAY